jgi:hypothetical protein
MAYALRPYKVAFVGRNKTTQAQRVVAFPATRALPMLQMLGIK